MLDVLTTVQVAPPINRFCMNPFDLCPAVCSTGARKSDLITATDYDPLHDD